MDKTVKLMTHLKFFFLSKVEKTFRCGIHNWASCYF